MTLKYDVDESELRIHEENANDSDYKGNPGKFTIEENVEVQSKGNFSNNSANEKPREDDEWLDNLREILPDIDPYEDESARRLELGTNKHLEEMVINSRRLLGDFMGDLIEKTTEVRFASGSKYVGTWDSVGMAGVGRYTMPCGVVYEGEFRDNMFHGRGSLQWPKGQRIDGVWKRGILQAKRYTFADGLVFRDSDWDYCKFPDRRFQKCIDNGLRPAGKTLETNRQPTRCIPHRCYDTGRGVFDPKLDAILSYDSGKMTEFPSKTEIEWIQKKCRKGWMVPTGYRPWLQENLLENEQQPHWLPFSHKSPEHWWKRLTTFERDTSVTIDEGKHIEAEEKGSFRKVICDDFTVCMDGGKWNRSETICTASRSLEDIVGGDNLEIKKHQEECGESAEEIIYEH